MEQDSIFEKILNVIEKVETVAMVVFLAIMTGLNALGIITRVLFGRSFVWIYPLTLLLFSWLVFIGAAVVFCRKEYIIVEYFVNFLPYRWRRWINIIVNFLVMGFFVFILTKALMIVEMQAQKMQVIRLPRYTQSLPLFIGSASILLFLSYDTWMLIKRRE